MQVVYCSLENDEVLSSLDYADTGAYVLHDVPNPLHCKGWRSFGRRFSANNSFEKTLERSFEEVLNGVAHFHARVPHPRELPVHVLQDLRAAVVTKRPREEEPPNLRSTSRKVDPAQNDAEEVDLTATCEDKENISTLIATAKAKKLQKKFTRSKPTPKGQAKLVVRQAGSKESTSFVRAFVSQFSGGSKSSVASIASTSGTIACELQKTPSDIVDSGLAREVLNLLVDCPTEFVELLPALCSNNSKRATSGAPRKLISEKDLQFQKHHQLQPRHLPVLARMQAVGVFEGTVCKCTVQLLCH